MVAASIVNDTSPSTYPPGALSRFLAWVDELPGHGWWLYLAMAGALFAWSHGVLWLSGRLPAGEIQPLFTVSVAYGPFTLAVLAYINRAAERALRSFWPATGWPDEAMETWRHALVTPPARYGMIAFVLGLVVATGAFLSAPSEVLGTGSDKPFFFAAYLPSAFAGYALVVFALLHTTRQLRLIARIHQEARRIDPFDRVPLYAFSGVTVRTGLAYVFAGYYTVTLNGQFQEGNVVGVIVLGAIFAFGAACFVLPLWGIHERLVHEKDGLLNDVERRMSMLGEEMYRRIDGGQFDGTKVVSEALAGVLALRDRVARLPTWPWPPNVLRGFISALLLPVVVYIVSRLIGGRIGA